MINYEYLTFDGVSSLDYGVKISGGGTYGAPQRVYEPVAVNGRNGNLLIDSQRYENYELIYPAYIAKDFESRIEGFRNFLLSRIGYKRLEDTYHPDEFRMAVFASGLEVQTTPLNRGGRFNVVFNCKPQRWLKSGEDARTITSGEKLINPTAFDARPLIRVYGSGTLVIGSQTVTIASHNKAYLDIDTEIMDCFFGGTNMNSYVTFVSNSYPILTGGSDTTVTFSGISSVIITPRWWKL